jgi:hypothetical protein
MSDCRHHLQPVSSAAALALLFACSVGLGGCANMSDTVASAFADPAKYDSYDCKQLQAERKRLALREAEMRGLMAKAETGAGGSVVGELAYRNDAISAKASANLANEVWERNKCVAVPDKVNAAPVSPAAPDDARMPPPQAPVRPGVNSVY